MAEIDASLLTLRSFISQKGGSLLSITLNEAGWEALYRAARDVLPPPPKFVPGNNFAGTIYGIEIIVNVIERCHAQVYTWGHESPRCQLSVGHDGKHKLEW